MTDPDPSDLTIEPTKETYDQFREAYEYLNRTLFNGELPNCLITLQRSKSSYGYFCGDRFGRADGLVTDEIALNPRYFHDHPIIEVLSTLAHEMVHLWQHHYGKPGRGRYHNRQWAERMKLIGLQPSSTGKEGGQETGDHVSDYVLTGGPFDVAVRELLARGFAITWTEKTPEAAKAPVEGEGSGLNTTGPKNGKRVKYTCPCCRLNAWARHHARLICGGDNTPMAPVRTKT
jgi:hypothetical protein